MLILSSVSFLIVTFSASWYSIKWWLDAKSSSNNLYANFLNVDRNISIDSFETIYKKEEFSTKSNGYTSEVAIINHSCEDNDTVEIFLRLPSEQDGKQSGDQSIYLKCSDLSSKLPTKPSSTFSFVINNKGDWELVNNPEKVKKSSSFFTNAFAEEKVIYTTASKKYLPFSNEDEAIQSIVKLQDMSTLLAPKLEIVERLNMTDFVLQDMNKYGLNRSYKYVLSEPLYATLLDLQRHNYPQLSIKTKNLITKLPIDKDLLSLSKSKEKNDQYSLSIIIKSLSLNEVSVLKQKAVVLGADGELLLNAIQINEVTSDHALPTPTATPEGDRFYVSAQWNNKNKLSRDCISNAYGNHMDRQDIAEKIAKTKSTRIVYYDKEWATTIYRDLSSCPEAKVSFISGMVVRNR